MNMMTGILGTIVTGELSGMQAILTLVESKPMVRTMLFSITLNPLGEFQKMF